jgi:hypothetical protein
VTFAAYAEGRGGCQLIDEPGHEVWGLLYELSDEELAGLDTISGVPQGFYRRVEVDVLAESGQRVAAVTYVIPNPLGLFRPTEAYTRPILAGARALPFPTGYRADLEATVAAALI